MAERSWSDMAGADSVEDVERVVQRFDPQYQSAREVAQDAAGVRAAATLVDRATQRWEETWRSIGYPAPDLEDDAWVTRMADRLTRAGGPGGRRGRRERPSRGGRAGGARAGGEAG